MIKAVARWMFIGLTAVIVLIGAPCEAAPDASPATLALMRAGLDQGALAKREGRLTLVETVRAYCQEIAGAYPRNSPTADAWLNGELESGGDRALRAMGTAEQGRRKAKVFTESCARWTEAASAVPDRPRYYVGLAYEFSRFSQDAEIFASRNGIDGQRYAFFLLDDTAQSLMLAALMADDDAR